MPDRPGLRLLGVSFALSWASTSMVAGPGGAVIVDLTGRDAFAGVFIALFFVGSALGGALGGQLMERHGRRPVFFWAYLMSASGFVVAGLGEASLLWFVVGTLIFASGFGVANLSRLAAAELVPAEGRGRAVATVQWAATIGAVIGPGLLIASPSIGLYLDRPALSLVWWFAPPLLVVAALLTRALPHPWPAAPTQVDTGSGRVPAVATIMGSHAAMIAVMGVAGAAVIAAGASASTLGLLMLAHFFGMFGFSRIVGRIVDGWGRRPAILLGLLTLAAGAAITALDGLGWFGVGLLVVGVGWSLSYISGTVLFTDLTPTGRAAALGKVDLATALFAGTISILAGIAYGMADRPGLAVVAIVLALLPLPLLLQRPRPAVAPV